MENVPEITERIITNTMASKIFYFNGLSSLLYNEKLKFNSLRCLKYVLNKSANSITPFLVSWEQLNPKSEKIISERHPTKKIQV